MGVRSRFFRMVGRQLFERPARKRSFAELAQELGESGDRIVHRLAAVSPSPEDLERMRHIVGIERWGQRRLRVFLGEPFVRDGHHPYKPADTLGWQALLEAFRETRAQTLAMVDELATPETERAAPVEHNDLGAFSAKGWLKYLKAHAEAEAKRIR